MTCTRDVPTRGAQDSTAFERSKRFADVVLSAFALLVLAPVFALAALLVRASSPGPVLYRARRVGRGGREFTMFKFRTMHVAQHADQSRITADRDPRVSPVGVLLRRWKIDELPQLVNVVRGDMSIVGPRPEDPRLVRDHYAAPHWETLRVRPGLSSPGSLYAYTHGERLLGTADPEGDYVARLLPIKLALDTVYVRRASLRYDARIVGRTMLTVLATAFGRRGFALPHEVPDAELVAAEWGASGGRAPAAARALPPQSTRRRAPRRRSAR